LLHLRVKVSGEGELDHSTLAFIRVSFRGPPAAESRLCGESPIDSRWSGVNVDGMDNLLHRMNPSFVSRRSASASLGHSFQDRHSRCIFFGRNTEPSDWPSISRAGHG
jgi:hypothetical protein